MVKRDDGESKQQSAHERDCEGDGDLLMPNAWDRAVGAKSSDGKDLVKQASLDRWPFLAIP
jgi:hypothetical protein